MIRKILDGSTFRCGMVLLSIIKNINYGFRQCLYGNVSVDLPTLELAEINYFSCLIIFLL